jgi:hypothetical protein
MEPALKLATGRSIRQVAVTWLGDDHMSTPPAPVSLLFSRVYIDKGKAISDSVRFRARLSSLLPTIYFSKPVTAALILRETGATVPTGGTTNQQSYYFGTFLKKAELRDLLDAITLIFLSIDGNDKINAQQRFRSEVERMMREENLSYRMDEAGGVHYYVDEEFERSRNATIVGLSGDQFQAAREALDDAHRALLSHDTLSGVRRSFDAVENVFKIRFGTPRLGASEIKSKLNPTLPDNYSGRATDAANRLAAAFAEWTNAAHQFRHAPGVADPSPPPMDMAILMMSEAASYLRWLISLKG